MRIAPPRMWATLGPTLALVLLACSNDRVLVAPELPPAVAWAAVVLFDASGQVVGASGLHRRDEDGSFLFAIDQPGAGAAARISVVGYEAPQLTGYAPPTEEALAASPLSVALPGQRRLPAQPAFAACADFESGSIELSACQLPAMTSGWLAACPSPCDLFPLGAMTNIPLVEATAKPKFAVLEEPSRAAALVYTTDHEVFRVTSTTALPWTRTTTSVELHQGVASGDGSLLVINDVGTVLALRPQQDAQRLSRAPGRPDVYTSLVGAPAGSLELFAGDRQGGISSYDGVRWKLHYEAPEPGCCKNRLLWRGPHSVVMLLPEANRVVFVKDDQVTVDEALNDPRTAGEVPGLGLVVGTAGRTATSEPPELFVLRDGRWVELPDLNAGVGEIPRGIWPIGAGFLFGGLRGRVSYHVPGLGSCGPRAYGEENFESMILVGDLYVVVPFYPDGTGPVFQLLAIEVVRHQANLAGCTDP